MSLQLDVLATSQRFLFEAIDFQTLTLGRVDPRTGRTPDVDLSQSKGLELGVSRHHASMMRREGALYLVDENSANGTYLNGQRLVAEQPRILRDGDDIRMGRLVMRVSFRTVEASVK
jgi:pSer/pThr/pTyr-binding forkhead associated (FHA) protein